MKFAYLGNKKAERIRWETLKLLDWDNDKEIIERIVGVINPRFFTSRTSEEIIDYIRTEINLKKLIDGYTGTEGREVTAL